MSFRRIKPSRGDSQTSSKRQSTPDSPDSDPRATVPSGGMRGSGPAKRRQKPEHITKNACTTCQKARTKCDGQKPCQRCTQRAELLKCVYEAHVKQTKEDLVNRIKELEAQNYVGRQILQALSADHRTTEILQCLKGGESYESIFDRLGPTRNEENRTVSPTRSQYSAPDTEMLNTGFTSHWTTVTTNADVLDHLFQLYFSWVHPVHTLFSEGYFVDSYKRQSTAYCSPNLVNAICAMSCFLHTASDVDDVDYYQLGMDFSDAVGCAIDPLDKDITTIQALAVMFLVDCARGRSLRASAYLKIATESLPFIEIQKSDGFSEVLRSTHLGIWCLHVEWSMVTFQKPISSKPSTFDALGDEEKLDGFSWYDYRYQGDAFQASPGLFATANREKVKLVEIIHAITSMYCGPEQHVSANQVLLQYERLLRWRSNLPNSILDFETTGGPVLPHIVSLLILYCIAVTHLLCPLLQFDGVPPAPVADVIWDYTQHALYLLDEQYRRQFTCRYQPVFQIFGILHLCDIIGKFFPTRISQGSKNGPEAVQFGLEALMHSRESFPIGGPLQDLLRRSAIEQSILLPSNVDTLMASPNSPGRVYRLDEYIDACTQPSYAQPVFDISRKYDAESFASEWPTRGPALGFVRRNLEDQQKRDQRSAEERNAQNAMEIRSLLNKN